MRVEVSGYQFIFPPQCVCCDSRPDTVLTVMASKTSGEKIKRTKTNTWDFPYCFRCIRHIEAANTAVIVMMVMGVVSLLLAIVAGLSSIWFGVFVAVMGLVGTIFVFTKMINNAERLRTNTCACLNPAVRFSDWDGTRQMFEIDSHKYAHDFMVANQRKLINLSLEAREMLEGSGYMDKAMNVQSARRYRSKDG